ncbi:hypothetical protein Lfu02_60000 [Longispora fulva]|uniref:Uncharacterized protein n=1 Tax=Longispora fulva TaxID=619741 RepID=A0A8J7GIF5_9ACTN|nr:nucleotidyltransferase domain-containing protein [Longispora fulva]MBG6137018.1 hypothetical protein [Longispora fulva]GIG61628.1 hypothetical protein Lfu02_60000 [Longispora fulva]
MEPTEAEQLLADHGRARDTLLRGFTTAAAGDNLTLWLLGSLASGVADAWSDLDLLVVAGPAPVGDPALVVVNPANGPQGGGYTGGAYLAGPLLIWVDWFTWPAELPVPAGARLLTGDGRPGTLPLFDALDRHGRGTRRAEPDRDTFALAMIPIAAKYVARGELEDSAGMIAMLGGDPDGDHVAALRALLRAIADHGPVTERVARTIDVAEALRG